MKQTNRTLSALIIGCITLLLTEPVTAQIKPAAVITDNMVLQQQTQAPLWGTATPGKEIKITPSWNGQTYTTTATSDGKWMLKVPTPSAGGPYTITLSEHNTITLKNILIGEVWLCSGQSNMEMPLEGWGKVDNYETEIAQANYPRIRLLQVEKTTSLSPLPNVTVSGGQWQTCSPATVAQFSSTAYFFGRNLYQTLNIPIGLIHTSWGGTPAEAWTSHASLNFLPDYAPVLNEINQMPADPQARKALFKEKQDNRNKEIDKKDLANRNNSDWQTTTLPGVWERNNLPGFDGIVWYKKEITILADWDGKDLALSLGSIDDDEKTYFNGTEIGHTEGASVQRKYTIPGRLVQKGKAEITVRVIDTGGDGGFSGSENSMYIARKIKSGYTNKTSLAGEWSIKPSLNLKDIPPLPTLYTDHSWNPGGLYNAMIYPIVPYAIKGAIWYQGESNANRAYQYRTLFPLMITDWRTQWGTDFPFYFVQLANFMQSPQKPEESDWAELREAQLQTLHLKNTGMAVTIDIGNATDIHPKNKQEVGNRLALAARAQTYGEKIPYSGPLYQSYKIEAGQIRLSFTCTDGGLQTKNNSKLQGFGIAGPNRKFYWANAVIDGNEIVVSCSEVPFPVAVRYAWAANPVCNLYNGAGLPASPFRTDDWPGVTIGNK